MTHVDDNADRYPPVYFPLSRVIRVYRGSIATIEEAIETEAELLMSEGYRRESRKRLAKMFLEDMETPSYFFRHLTGSRK